MYDFPPLLLLAGDVVRLWVLTCTSGGNVRRYAHSGPRFFKFIIKSMRNFWPPTPEIALLSMLPGSVTSQKLSLFNFFLSAAWQIIPLFGKTDVAPPLSLWVYTVKDILWMEEMLALDIDSFDKFKVLWYIWIHFSFSLILSQKCSQPLGVHPHLSVT